VRPRIRKRQFYKVRNAEISNFSKIAPEEKNPRVTRSGSLAPCLGEISTPPRPSFVGTSWLEEGWPLGVTPKHCREASNRLGKMIERGTPLSLGSRLLAMACRAQEDQVGGIECQLRIVLHFLNVIQLNLDNIPAAFVISILADE
jgi:hypothetical protein